MPAMPWFRFYHEALDDPKVQQLPPPLYKHWVNLLCLANKGTPRGALPAADIDTAFALRVNLPQVRKILTTLRQAGLLECTEGGILYPHNWEKRQQKSDDVTARVTKHRAGKAQGVKQELGGYVTLQETLHETPLEQRSNVIEEEEEREEETEREVIFPAREPASTPQPATVLPDVPVRAVPKRATDGTAFVLTPELRAWVAEEEPGLNADREAAAFLDHAVANGKLYKDWRAAFRNWCRKSTSYSTNGQRASNGQARPAPRDELPPIPAEPTTVQRAWQADLAERKARAAARRQGAAR